MFGRSAQFLAFGLVLALAGWARAQQSDEPAGRQAETADAKTKEVEPRHIGHLEAPGQPFVPMPRETQRTSPAARMAYRGYVSVQVNVDDNGDNIVGDAANEPSLAADPVNHNNMTIGWRQFDTILNDFRQAGYGYTADGGQTWTFPTVIDPGHFRSDPVVDSDAQGNFFYNSLTNEGGYWCNVYKSIDGGATWDDGTYAYGGDKQWQVIDTTDGIGQGNIYASWNEVYSICDGHFTRSANDGLSFEPCTTVPGSPYWGTLDVGPDGELYVCGDGFTVARSDNAKFALQSVVWNLSTTVSLGGSMVFSSGPNPSGLLGQAWIAVDHSDGPTRGYVYLLCSVDPSGADPLDVMFARSTDGGATWSSPVRVNDDASGNGAWQWFGTMSVAPTGRIDTIWLDTRSDPGGYDSQLYYSYSDDTGVTWSPNEALSPSFDPHLGWPIQQKMGDYFDMTSDEFGADLAYAATFNGEQDVYYIRIGDPHCPDAGMVRLDRAKYPCEGTVNVEVLDCGLNTDDELTEEVVVDIDSDSETGVEEVLLTETNPASAQFTGSIDVRETDSAGVLRVTEGDTITVTYIDADDGQGGVDVEVTATAPVDCTPPIISAVQTTDIGPRVACVTFNTDEPCRGSVRYGHVCEGLTETASEHGYGTEHSVRLAGLNDDETYYYAVDAEDEAGNVATDDNGGFCYSFTTPGIPDFFTQEFGAGNDLDNLSLIFTPNESPDYYVGCVEPITDLPTDPTDGTTISLSVDDYEAVTLDLGATVSLYGVTYSTLYVGSNGYITFGSGDTDYTESLGDHFDLPRISALFDDLNPSSAGTVSWKQLADRVVVTWEEVPEYSTSNSNTFQIEMFFDGIITINYLTLDASDGLAGLSEGEGLSPDYYVTDLSDMGACVALAIELPEGTPWRVDPAVPTAMAVLIDDGGETVLPEMATLHYRFDGGAFLTNQMNHLGGNVYEATLPAAFCDQTPEFYFAATGDGGTTLYNPPDAPASYYSAVVASMTVLLDDDFETDQGWTVVDDSSVEAGTWERGLPADDGTEGDPISDYDGSGQCYLTGNSPGNSDVDGGPTMLTSPMLDLGDAENPVVRYARWWSNDDQDGDPFDVEVSNDGGQSWAPIERVADIPPGWIERTVYLTGYTAPSSQTLVRFSASDVPNNSKTEGGLDAVTVFDLGCLGPGTGDYDGDEDMDLADYGAFQGCYNGPATGTCAGAFEFVGNGQIDLDDLASFVPVLTGPKE